MPAMSVQRSDAHVEIKHKLPDLPLGQKYRGREFYFVRVCYDVYYLKVEALLLEEKEDCVTVTGTPGIGTSIFYAYFFDRFKEAHPDWTIIASSYTPNGDVEQLAVFELNKKEMHFSRATQELLNALVLKISVVDLLDDTIWSKAREPPKNVLWLCDGPPKINRRQTVVFTSPNKRWMKESRKDLCTFYMPPWTLEELQLAASVLGYPISDDDMDERFWNFGGVARNCFLVEPSDIALAISQLTKSIQQIISRDMLEKLLLKAGKTDFLLYEPIGDGMRVDTKLMTNWVSEKLSERLLHVLKLQHE